MRTLRTSQKTISATHVSLCKVVHKLAYSKRLLRALSLFSCFSKKRDSAANSRCKPHFYRLSQHENLHGQSKFNFLKNTVGTSSFHIYRVTNSLVTISFRRLRLSDQRSKKTLKALLLQAYRSFGLIQNRCRSL